MIGWKFGDVGNQDKDNNVFDRLLKLFKELLLHTSGDVDEALSWLTELDRQYKLTTPEYGLADFIQDLKDQGFIPGSRVGETNLPLKEGHLFLVML